MRVDNANSTRGSQQIAIFNSELAQLKDFMIRYRSYTDEISDEAWNKTKPEYDRLLKGFKDEWERYLELESTDASNYNIFRILRTYFSEINTHTPFLANLLDPAGSHAQRDLFYREFVKNCLTGKKQGWFLDVSENHLYIKVEKRNPYGQIDIGVYSKKPGNRFALFIENKIGAPDQDKQLYRYYLYATKGLGLNNDQISIVYLKPENKGPDLSKLNDKQKADLNAVLIQVRYTPDELRGMPNIADFLAASLPSIKSKKVKTIIKQYLQTIKDLFR